MFQYLMDLAQKEVTYANGSLVLSLIPCRRTQREVLCLFEIVAFSFVDSERGKYAVFWNFRSNLPWSFVIWKGNIMESLARLFNNVVWHNQGKQQKMGWIIWLKVAVSNHFVMFVALTVVLVLFHCQSAVLVEFSCLQKSKCIPVVHLRSVFSIGGREIHG